MDNFTKVVNPGVTRDSGHLWAKITFIDGKLSITGVEGPKSNGNARGSCGQIVMHDWDLKEYSTGWDANKVEAFRRFWDQWHLNDCTAGSPAQEAWLKANPIKAVYPVTHYDLALDGLTKAGLQPDASYLHNGKPYSYGSAWLHVDVPEDVLRWLRDLPESSLRPAWV